MNPLDPVLLSHLPPGGWAALLLVVVVIMTGAGIKIITVIGKPVPVAHVCNMDAALVRSIERAVDRQQEFIADQERYFRTLETAVNRNMEAINRLNERLILDMAYRQRALDRTDKDNG